PESAEYFSQVIGTTKTTKYTERKKKGILSEHDTGDASAREVDEFIIHPNKFKSQLGVGEGVMVIPHEYGSRTVSLKFKMFDDMAEEPMPEAEKEVAGPLSILEPNLEQSPQNKKRRMNESA
ncbi:MAG: hypothetical protein KDD43_14570, partial [Bdellovibrionales bacterium]|nr:hypothetical protein [Bdellovibrionales bacterium]